MFDRRSALFGMRRALAGVSDSPVPRGRSRLNAAPASRRARPCAIPSRPLPQPHRRALLSPIFLQVVNFTTYAAGRATAIMRAFERIQHRAMSPLPTASIRLFARHYASHPTFELHSFCQVIFAIADYRACKLQHRNKTVGDGHGEIRGDELRRLCN